MQKINKKKNINTYIFTLSTNSNNILLYEKFGSASAYGSNYKTIILDDRLNSINSDKLLNCGTKFVTCDPMTNSMNSNIKEINLLHKVSKFALYNINPNVPILYKSYKLDISNYKHNKIAQTLYPKFRRNKCAIFENKKLESTAYCYINEIFNGDARAFIRNFSHDYKLLINAISNIIISILTFWSITKKSHDDCHMGNFLFTKLKDPINENDFYEYNIYGKKIYIRNLGFLWTSWDYGLAIDNYPINIIRKNLDLNDIPRALEVFKYHLETDNNTKMICQLYRIYNNHDSINYKYIHLFKSIVDYIINTTRDGNGKGSNKYNMFLYCFFTNKIKTKQILDQFNIFIKNYTLNIDKMYNLYKKKFPLPVKFIFQKNNSLNSFLNVILNFFKNNLDNYINNLEGGNIELIKRNNKINKQKEPHPCSIIKKDGKLTGTIPTDDTLIYFLFIDFLDKLSNPLPLNKKLISFINNDTDIPSYMYEPILNTYIIDKKLSDFEYRLSNNKRTRILYDLIIQKKIWDINYTTDKIKDNIFDKRDNILNFIDDIVSNYKQNLIIITNNNKVNIPKYDFTDQLSIMTINYFIDKLKHHEDQYMLFYDILPDNGKIINKKVDGAIIPYYIGNGNIGYKWKKIKDDNIINYYLWQGSDITTRMDPTNGNNLKNLLIDKEYIILQDSDIKNNGIDKIADIYDPLNNMFSLFYLINEQTNEFYVIDNDINSLLLEYEKNEI